MTGVGLRHLGTGEAGARWCADVYRHSWPHGARGSYTDEELAERLAARPLRYWEQLLVRSTVRLAGTHDGARGFATVTPEDDGDELSYLFVEPAAFGTGLADELHTAALDAHRGPLRAWTLAANHRALAFLGARGWAAGDPGLRPAWDGGHHYLLLEHPGS